MATGEPGSRHGQVLLVGNISAKRGIARYRRNGEIPPMSTMIPRPVPVAIHSVLMALYLLTLEILYQTASARTAQSQR